MTSKAIGSEGAPLSAAGDDGIDWSAVDLDGLVAGTGPSPEEREERLAASSPLSEKVAGRSAPSALTSGDTAGEGHVDPSDDWGLPR